MDSSNWQQGGVTTVGTPSAAPPPSFELLQPSSQEEEKKVNRGGGRKPREKEEEEREEQVGGGAVPQEESRPAQGSSRRQPCRRPLAGASKGRTGALCCKSLAVRTQEDIWYLCDVQPPTSPLTPGSELEFKWKIMTPSPYVDYYYI